VAASGGRRCGGVGGDVGGELCEAICEILRIVVTLGWWRWVEGLEVVVRSESGGSINLLAAFDVSEKGRKKKKI